METKEKIIKKIIFREEFFFLKHLKKWSTKIKKIFETKPINLSSKGCLQERRKKKLFLN